jgi:hypothetical protein
MLWKVRKVTGKRWNMKQTSEKGLGFLKCE